MRIVCIVYKIQDTRYYALRVAVERVILIFMLMLLPPALFAWQHMPGHVLPCR